MLFLAGKPNIFTLVNRLILEPNDFITSDLVLIQGSRAEHLRVVCKLGPGDPVKIGVLNGPIGRGELLESLSEGLKIRFIPDLEPQLALQSKVTVLLALPRPQMLKRVFQKSATFGIKRLVLFRSERVEKSYFSSPVLNPEEIKRNLILGLEQGGTTRLPEVLVFPAQTEFSEWRKVENLSNKFLLSLTAKNNILDFSQDKLEQPTFLIGPEGGFIPREEERFIEEGFIPLRIADSILRVESAFDFILAQHTLLQMSSKNKENLSRITRSSNG